MKQETTLNDMIDTGNKGKGFWHVSIGNVISWVVVAVGFIAGGQKMYDRVETLTTAVAKQETSMEEWRSRGVLNLLADHERRLIAMEQASADVREMRTDLKWIKQAIERDRK